MISCLIDHSDAVSFIIDLITQVSSNDVGCIFLCRAVLKLYFVYGCILKRVAARRSYWISIRVSLPSDYSSEGFFVPVDYWLVLRQATHSS